jgi:hypothetical protein
MRRDAGWLVHIRFMMVGAEDRPPLAELAACARATPSKVLPVWLLEHPD